MTAIKKRLRVGVIFGGRSGEHEVSLASAASVIRALDPEKYEAVPIGISKDGRWLVGSGAEKMLPEVLKSGDRVMLPADPTAAQLVPVGASTGQPSVLVDVVFPVLARHFWRRRHRARSARTGGSPLRWLRRARLGGRHGQRRSKAPFRASRSAGRSISRHSPLAMGTRSPQSAARSQKEVPFPDLREARNARLVGGHDARKRAARTTKGDGLGRRIRTEDHRRARSQRARNRSFSAGQQEIRASIPGEIVPHREFYDYAAKYLEGGTQLVIPAKLTKKQVTTFQNYAVRAFRAIDGTGMARCDFFLDRTKEKSTSTNSTPFPASPPSACIRSCGKRPACPTPS